MTTNERPNNNQSLIDGQTPLESTVNVTTAVEIPDQFCRFCCALLVFYVNPREDNPNVRQAVCCSRSYYRRLQ